MGVTRLRLKPGWTLLVGANSLTSVDPEGSVRSVATLEERERQLLLSWVDSPDASLQRVARDLMEQVEILEEHVQASSLSLPVKDWSYLIDNRLDPAAGYSFDRFFGPPKEEVADGSRGSIVLVLRDFLGDWMLRLNKELVAGGGMRVLPVCVQGDSISAGPFIAPELGGPCLRCLSERSNAMLAGLASGLGDTSVVVRVGSNDPTDAMLDTAAALARQMAQRLSKSVHVIDLMHMVRLRESLWQLEMLPCHPLPHCPDCSVIQAHG